MVLEALIMVWFRETRVGGMQGPWSLNMVYNDQGPWESPQTIMYACIHDVKTPSGL